MFHLRVMSTPRPTPTVAVWKPPREAKETEMVPSIWTELLAKERIADLRREAERERLLRLAPV